MRLGEQEVFLIISRFKRVGEPINHLEQVDLQTDFGDFIWEQEEPATQAEFHITIQAEKAAFNCRAASILQSHSQAVDELEEESSKGVQEA